MRTKRLRTVATDQTKGSLSIFTHFQQCQLHICLAQRNLHPHSSWRWTRRTFFSSALPPPLPPSMFGISVPLSDQIRLPVAAPGLPSWETPSRNLGGLVCTVGCHLGPWTAGEIGFHFYGFPALRENQQSKQAVNPSRGGEESEGKERSHLPGYSSRKLSCSAMEVCKHL
jgi:hypothetical protein